MPDYSKLHELVSHRVALEYDTGVRIVGYLASCQPGTGQVQFVRLSRAEVLSPSGQIIERFDQLAVVPNVLSGFALDEGPSGRNLER
jgi:hypothetical protein